MHADALASGRPLAASIIDIDKLSAVNQQYGNDAGDQLMYQLAQRFDETFERFFVARGDGNQFFVLLSGLSNEKAVSYVEKVRQIISSEHFVIDDADVSLTYTAGVSNVLGESIDDLMLSATKCLKRASNAGGDLVFGD